MTKTEVNWPLFHCLEPEVQVKLMQYQWDNFGTKLNIPPSPDTPQSEGVVLTETPEEIERLMKQKPRPRQVQ